MKNKRRSARRRIQYAETTRITTFEISRKSPDDFWQVDHCNWILKLKTGPYVALEKPVEPVQIAKPIPAPDKPEKAGLLLESPPPQPPVEPQSELTEEIRDTTAELNERKARLASLEEQLAATEASGYPDTVVLTTGREMECEILEENENSVRIKTSTGIATVSKDRIESCTYATESEKAQALEAKSRSDEIRKQIHDVTLQIEDLQPAPKKSTDEPHLSRANELLDYAKDGDEGMVSKLLDVGMAADVRDHNERTPLMLAAFEGHDAIVVALLDAGADLAARDVDGWEALTYAAYGGKTETVRLLIENGANVNARVNSGQSVMTIAKQKGHQEVIDLLLREGANP